MPMSGRTVEPDEKNEGMDMRRGMVAVGLAMLCLVGCGGENSGGGTSTPPAQQAATPTFSPAAGTFTSAQTVTISDSTSGASIYYTTNGTTPTQSSTLYTAPIAISATTTIEAIASDAPSYTNSNVATATYTINLPAAATPTFSPAPGTFTSAQSVTLSD